MIPKIIHLCWLSGDPYPPLIKDCIESWKRHLPDYEIWLWDTKRFDVKSVLWTKQAYECRKYAFAADYIRLYALYHYGGIYLDSDIFVYKSFDDLLDLSYFIGEDFIHLFEPAVIGCEPYNPWIAQVMKRYEERAFILPDGKYDMTALPIVFRQQLEGKWQFNLVNKIDEFSNKDGIMNVFRYDFFNSRDYIGEVRFQNSYCSHCFLGSWLKSETRMKTTLRKRLPRSFVNLLYFLRYKATDLTSRQIPFSDDRDLRLRLHMKDSSETL